MGHDKGVVAQASAERLVAGAEMWEVPDINDLPVPRYDEYVDQVADRFGVPAFPTPDAPPG